MTPLLDRERLTNYPRIFLALYVTIGGWWLFTGSGLLDRSGKPIGVDFVTFWAASSLALQGEAAGAWNLVRITAVERAVIGAEIPPYAFHYPPTFLLFLAPLALLAYPYALLAWWSATVAAFLSVVRRIAPTPVTAGLALAFPGFFQNIIQGQNGAFTAALLGAGLLEVDRRPLVGGALLGMLSYKPHLAPLVGLALLAGRRWRALGAAVVTALVAAGVSALVFGPEAWVAFRGNVPFALRVLETEGVLPWFRMPTVQVAAMLLGAPPPVARIAQGVSTLVAAILVARVWGQGASLAARASVLACAAILATPFAFDYDLAVLAIPVAFLGYDRWKNGWQRGERPLLVAAWAAPLAAPAIAEWTSVSLTPLLLLALVWTASLRTAAARTGALDAPAAPGVAS
ncbi:MAG: glycosyltransferase family 87 protein [Pseudomonadota bacterium]|nr:glycosyltransferase family 87 protein [Pseudomonadota bacterium]